MQMIPSTQIQSRKHASAPAPSHGPIDCSLFTRARDRDPCRRYWWWWWWWCRKTTPTTMRRGRSKFAANNSLFGQARKSNEILHFEKPKLARILCLHSCSKKLPQLVWLQWLAPTCASNLAKSASQPARRRDIVLILNKTKRRFLSRTDTRARPVDSATTYATIAEALPVPSFISDHQCRRRRPRVSKSQLALGAPFGLQTNWESWGYEIGAL